MPSDSSDQPSDSEDDLPVLAWEDVSRRVRLPDDLREALGLPVSQLRWSSTKFRRVIQEHSKDATIILALEAHLQHWECAGPQAGREGTWQVIFRVNTRAYIAFIGRDERNSYNMVTVFGTKREAFVKRRSGEPGMVWSKREAPAPLDEAEIS